MVLLTGLAFIHLLLAGVLVLNLVDMRRRGLVDEAKPLPSVSILIPARNEAENLRHLIPSLLAQAYRDFEIVVYDDGSEDATPEVLDQLADRRLRVVQGGDLPPGWIGKPHALYRATQVASRSLYLFLDADVVLTDPKALQRLVRRYAALPDTSVMTGTPTLQGGGRLLVSLIPHAMLTALPWPIVRRFRTSWLGGLNGQCWMIDAATYHRYEPHERFKAEVLEDVRIGGFLAGEGISPYMVDMRDEVQVRMYPSLAEAWRGFRKNAYRLMGGTVPSFLLLFVLFGCTYVVAPLLHPAFLASLYLLKTATDRFSRMPWWIPLLTPLSFLMALALQLDSAVHHWIGRVEWKGRPV